MIYYLDLQGMCMDSCIVVPPGYLRSLFHNKQVHSSSRGVIWASYCNSLHVGSNQSIRLLSLYILCHIFGVGYSLFSKCFFTSLVNYVSNYVWFGWISGVTKILKFTAVVLNLSWQKESIYFFHFLWFFILLLNCVF